jgi:hypothetical protein
MPDIRRRIDRRRALLDEQVEPARITRRIEVLDHLIDPCSRVLVNVHTTCLLDATATLPPAELTAAPF